MKRIFMTIIMLALAIGVFAGCGGADVDLEGHELVGQWAWYDNIGWRYVLNDDGTGTRGGAGNPIEDITWSVRGDNEIRVQAGRGAAHERWTYSISGYSLSLNRNATRESYNYIRVGAPYGDHALPGTWAWTDDADFEYNLSPDGSGMRGDSIFTEAFTWMLKDNDGFLLDFGFGSIELWTFDISGDVLTLSSQQAADLVFTYARVD